jgi:type VI secretion system lysozyme-like protein
MAAGLQQHRVTALLFDRLATRDRDGDSTETLPPVQTYGPEELSASIGEQLHWLLNTRVPVDYHTLDARTRRGERSTVDYGLPDLTAYPVGDPAARTLLCAHIAQTVEIYEPRLLQPRVSLLPIDPAADLARPPGTGTLRRRAVEVSRSTPDPRREWRGDVIVAEVSGMIRIGLIEAPVVFRVPLDAEKRPDHGG